MKTSEKPSEAKVSTTRVSIPKPNIRTGEVWVKGTAPLVIHKFSSKAIAMIRNTQMQGSTARTKKTRVAKDFTQIFNDARHISFDGWDGIPASAFRSACIRACSLTGCKMTMAKMSLFVEADGYDNTEGTPLVKIYGGKPHQLERMVRLATGVCDISVRPQWLEWGACIRFKFDADQFTDEDICNLVARAGAQVGICEGRPCSANSNGCGWGTFELSDEKTVRALEKK